MNGAWQSPRPTMRALQIQVLHCLHCVPEPRTSIISTSSAILTVITLEVVFETEVSERTFTIPFPCIVSRDMRDGLSATQTAWKQPKR